MEECAELIHILCKIKRFGLNNYHPDDKQKITNRELLFREIEDVEAVISEIRKKQRPSKVELKKANCKHGKGLNDYCLPCGRIHSLDDEAF